MRGARQPDILSAHHTLLRLPAVFHLPLYRHERVRDEYNDHDDEKGARSGDLMLRLAAVPSQMCVSEIGPGLIVTYLRVGPVMRVIPSQFFNILLSVVWNGSKLMGGQWGGVGFVFGGIGLQIWVKHQAHKKRVAAGSHAPHDSGHAKKSE